SKNWRDQPDLYRPAQYCKLKPGNSVLSPLKFPMCHGPGKSIPGPSGDVNPPDNGAFNFLEDILEVQSLFAAFLAIVHPELYNHQMALRRTLVEGNVDVHHKSVVEKILSVWASPFMGMAVVSNQETPVRRDMQGGGTYLYDLLASVGSYNGGRLGLSSLGLRFLYNPGCMVLLVGFSLQHGAARVEGDRVCLASFIKTNLSEAIDLTMEYPYLPMPQ
ncbi:hypothetical protein FA15DRAFT_604202, partial [Coprinopsis marcescibilis]